MKKPEDISKSQQKEIDQLKRAVNTLNQQVRTLDAGYKRVSDENRRLRNELETIKRMLRNG